MFFLKPRTLNLKCYQVLKIFKQLLIEIWNASFSGFFILASFQDTKKNFRYFTAIGYYFSRHISAFLLHIGICQLPSIITSAKKLLTSVFYGNQILLFPPSDILFGTSLCCLKILKNHNFQNHRQEVNALQESFIIYIYFLQI